MCTAEAKNRSLTSQRPTAEKLMKNQQYTENEILQLHFQEEKKKPEQTTQELKQIEMKTNKQADRAIKETIQDNDKQSNYEQMNKKSNEDFNKPTSKQKEQIKKI